MTEQAGIDELLDFDLVCDWNVEGPCGQVAHWAGVLSCCTELTIRCDLHRQTLDRLFRSRPRDGVIVAAHEPCGKAAFTVRWDVVGRVHR